MEIHLTTRPTECHLPYAITQCYLPPDTSEHIPPLPQPDRLVLDLPTRLVTRKKIKHLEVEGHVPRCPTAGYANAGTCRTAQLLRMFLNVIDRLIRVI